MTDKWWNITRNEGLTFLGLLHQLGQDITDGANALVAVATAVFNDIYDPNCSLKIAILCDIENLITKVTMRKKTPSFIASFLQRACVVDHWCDSDDSGDCHLHLWRVLLSQIHQVGARRQEWQETTATAAKAATANGTACPIVVTTPEAVIGGSYRVLKKTFFTRLFHQKQFPLCSMSSGQRHGFDRHQIDVQTDT